MKLNTKVVLTVLTLAAMTIASSCSTFAFKDESNKQDTAEVKECRPIAVKNSSGMPLSVDDLRNMTIATKRCKYHYPNSPCLVVFEVVTYHDYRATCGAKNYGK